MASPHKEPKSDFRTLVDLFFRWQRAHYHLWNIKQSREGAMDITGKMMDQLSKSHPVAESNKTIQAKMAANARSWADQNRDTMEIHYRQIISSMILQIIEANQQDWEEAWRVATKWMENRYKRKFNINILDWARQEVTPLRRNPPTATSTTTTQSHNSPSLENPETSVPSVTPTKAKKTPSKTKKQTPRKDKTTPKATRTTDREHSRTPKKRKSALEPASPSDPKPPKIKKPQTPSSEQKGPDQSHSSPLPDPEKPRTRTIRKLFEPRQSKTSTARSYPHPSQEAGPSKTQPLETNCFTRHEHHGNKTKNWSLRPNRPILILGDSNLGRLPKIYHGEVQLDCFPGAKIHHGAHILKHKTPVSPNVRVVILSFGLNNWAQNNHSIIQQNVNELVEAARNTFPNAKIHYAALNWSPLLPLATQANLAKINTIIGKTGLALDPLPKTHFQTENDLIHWTTATAQRIWRHWMSYLDL